MSVVRTVSKAQLSSSSVLVHYDPHLPVILACDASPYGVGAVISHVTRPIAYASRTLTKTEVNYAQIEKEALGVIFGVMKFHDYLYGRKFLLVTDHKPLVKILGPKTGVPALAAARLQRWALILAAYQYDIKYKFAQQHGNADALSRLPLSERGPESSQEFRVSFIDVMPITAKDIAREPASDQVLGKVKHFTLTGWPKHVTYTVLTPYWARRNELTVEGDCVLWGLRAVIPALLRDTLLRELHENHWGMVKMKALARSHFWWPKLDTEIEGLVKDCQVCQSNISMPPTAPAHTWKWPERLKTVSG